MRQPLKLLVFTCLLVTISMTCFANEKDIFPSVPSYNIYLQDYQRVTNRETNRIVMQTSTNLKNATTAEVAVVLIDSLHGTPIQEYSLGLFRKWGIGDKEKNNGVLILVVTSAKQVRIEVGYGLEGVLTDAKCGEIIREKMLPPIGKGDYNSGVIDGYLAVVQEVGHEYGIAPMDLHDNMLRSLGYKHWSLLESIFIQTMLFFAVALGLYLIYCFIKPQKGYKPGKIKKKHKYKQHSSYYGGGIAGENSVGCSGYSGGYGGGGGGGGESTGGGFGGGSGGGGGANS